MPLVLFHITNLAFIKVDQKVEGNLAFGYTANTRALTTSEPISGWWNKNCGFFFCKCRVEAVGKFSSYSVPVWSPKGLKGVPASQIETHSRQNRRLLSKRVPSGVFKSWTDSHTSLDLYASSIDRQNRPECHRSVSHSEWAKRTTIPEIPSSAWTWWRPLASLKLWWQY